MKSDRLVEVTVKFHAHVWVPDELWSDDDWFNDELIPAVVDYVTTEGVDDTECFEPRGKVQTLSSGDLFWDPGDMVLRRQL